MNELKPIADQWQYDERLSLMQKQMLSALRSTLCIITPAIEKVRELQKQVELNQQISKNAHHRWSENDDIYRMYFLDLKTEVKDFGESCLHTLMKGHEHKKITKRFTKEGDYIIEEETWQTPPDKTAVIFFNKTQNKDRGYVERQELTTPEGIRIEAMAPIILEVNKPKADEAGNS